MPYEGIIEVAGFRLSAKRKNGKIRTLTLYQLVRAFRKFGQLDEFDLPVHRTGPDAGRSKGFAFVSYEKEDSANRATELLNGKMFGSRRIRVEQANSKFREVTERSKIDNYLLNLSALAGPPKKNPNHEVALDIRAIEEKLKSMDKSNFED